MVDHGIDDEVRFIASAGGTADFHVQAAADTDHVRPQDANAIDTHKYEYYARVGAQYERGFGIWDQPTLTLRRSEINDTSNNDDARVNFSAPPTVDVFPMHAKVLEPKSEFAPTTAMVFYQATAPVGWTKQTSRDDHALRVVTGSSGGSYGGSYAFSTIFARYQTDSHAIDGNELTYHVHADYYQYPSVTMGGVTLTAGGNYPTYYDWVDSEYEIGAYTTGGAAGASYGHVHGVEMRVKYMDVIVATKD